jgi:glycosyltransferase involved in cell wall biosynthesis
MRASHANDKVGRDRLRPRVGLGMPVYNGERYILETIESILAQTFDDFELLILDNASTDGTGEICRDFEAKDERIRYIRNRENYGIVSNFNSVFKLSSGEYFKWASYDDVCGPDFLLRCTQVLDSDPSIVLSYPQIVNIDERGLRVEYPQDIPDVNSPDGMFSDDPVTRFRTWMRNLGFTEPLYGLIRADVLAKTPLHAHHFIGDHIVLSELCLHGKFYEIREDLFFRRVHDAMTTARVPTLRKRVDNLDVGPQARMGPYWWRLVRPYPRRVWWHLQGVRRAPLSHRERALCYGEVVRAAAAWVVRKTASAVTATRDGLAEVRSRANR